MKTVSEFRDELDAHYFEPGIGYGVTIDPDPTPGSEQQAIAWTSLKIILLCLNNSQTQKDLDQFNKCLEARERVPGLKGLYVRKPGDILVANAHDDLMYAAVASMLIDPKREVARAILNYGRANDWIFNTQMPGVKDPRLFQARFPTFIPMIKICAGDPVEWYESFFLGTGFAFGASDASGALKQFLFAICAYKNGGEILSFSKWLWIKSLYRRYPRGMVEVCENYFHARAPKHPFTWPEIWAGLPGGIISYDH